MRLYHPAFSCEVAFLCVTVRGKVLGALFEFVQKQIDLPS